MTWYSEHYHHYSFVQEENAKEAILRLNLKGKEKILDIGCGEGKISHKLANHAAKVVGLDISPSMIETARLTYQHVPNLSFYLGDAEHFHFDESFDIVTSFSALHWVRNHDAVLQNIARILKNHGRLSFVFVARGDSRIEEVMHREPWKSRLAARTDCYFEFQEADYEKLLAKHSFIQKRVEIAPLTYHFPDREMIIHHLMTWIPYQSNFDYPTCLALSEEISHNVSDLKLTWGLFCVEALKDSTKIK